MYARAGARPRTTARTIWSWRAPACNAAKADTPLLAFLMMRRSRGVYLLHYGEHLSDPLKELARKASERPMLAKGA